MVQEDSTITVDGAAVNLRAGDNVFSIIAKINESGVAVRARLDPVSSGLVMETTSPHQLWLEDGENGTVLKDLGILSDISDRPPMNIESSARLFGGSAFDMIIALRDQLANGATIDVGGRGVGGVTTALDNVLGRLGTLGSLDERLQLAFQRTENDIPIITARYSNEVDTDMTEAITELQMLEFTHRAALGAAARVIQPTLLDFLR